MHSVIGSYIRHFYEGFNHAVVVYVVVATIFNDEIFDVSCYTKAFGLGWENPDNTPPFDEQFYIDLTRRTGDKISKEEATALFPGIVEYTYRH